MLSEEVELGEELGHRARSLGRSLLSVFPLVTVISFISSGTAYLARH